MKNVLMLSLCLSAAFVVNADKKPSLKGVLQIGNKFFYLLRGFEIDAVEDDAARARGSKMLHDLGSDAGAWNADDKS